MVMGEKKEKWMNILTLAFTIALLPPLWAVFSGICGVTVGAVAMIVAGFYVAAGNTIKKAWQIMLGFLCGDVWAVIATCIMAFFNFNPNVELYSTLFVMGSLAVILGSLLEKWILVPAWLSGWAIGLSILGPLAPRDFGTLPLQIAVAMIAGVWYVGVVVDLFQRFLLKFLKSK